MSGVTSQFAYNGDGARLKQIVNGAVTTYTQDLAAPLPVVLQSKTVTATTQYVYDMDTSPLAQSTSGAWQYLLPDGLGSVRQIADAGGNVVLTEGYDPYGNVLNSSGKGSSAYGFTGEERDASGLTYLRARYMQPKTGIFLSHDPADGDQMQPGSMNGWNYAEGNPINKIDPTGQVACNGGLGECSGNNPDANSKPYVLPSGKYLYTQQYGWLDRSHIGAANPQGVINQVRRGILHGSGEVNVADGVTNGFRFRATYQVVGKEGATEEYINGVALGIYTDFEMRFELWEGLVFFPMTQYTTMYAIEDLPSDYLGFVMAAKHLTLEEAFACLESDSSKVTGTDIDPPRSWDSSEKNYWISPRVNGVNVAWPQALTITPIGLGDGTNAWRFVGSWGSGAFGIRGEK